MGWESYGVCEIISEMSRMADELSSRPVEEWNRQDFRLLIHLIKCLSVLGDRLADVFVEDLIDLIDPSC